MYQSWIADIYSVLDAPNLTDRQKETLASVITAMQQAIPASKKIFFKAPIYHDAGQMVGAVSWGVFEISV